MSGFWSAANLAAFAALRASARVDSCDILVQTATRNSENGQTTSWAVETADVPCRVTDPGLPAYEVEKAGRTTSVAQFLFDLPPDVTITERHRISYAGITYQVVSVSPTTYMVEKLARVIKAV